MKTVALLIVLLTAAGISALHAQQRTRDKLFPTYQQDVTALNQRMQQNENKVPAKPQSGVRSTKALLFSNYRPQPAGTAGSNATAARKSAGRQLPSDVTATEAGNAVKEAQARQPKPILQVPQQGNVAPEERKTPSPLKKN